MATQYIPEVKVLIEVAQWLHKNGWQIEKVSMPHGQGINQVKNNEELGTKLSGVGISVDDISFSSRGEDIRALQGNTIWRIECKGLGGSVATQTVRNNFDRAVASAVSYYTQGHKLRLGIAVPEEYIKLLRERVPQALRVAVNLWIFLYVSADTEIVVFAPDDEL